MAWIRAFGAYLPARVVANAELAARYGWDPDWIARMTGIEERRYAADTESVADLGAAAARDCLANAGMSPSDLGLILVSSGSSERRFPGPASSIAHALGLQGVPAIDFPLASAGSLFALALADRLVPFHGNVLIVAAEKMSSIATREPADRNIAPLFGDGAGACLVTPSEGAFRIVDSVLHSDGAFASDLQLGLDAPLQMNGLTVILQAGRKIPAAISEVLERNHVAAPDIPVFIMHQANQNLIDRVARAIGVPSERFFSNIRRNGNTSSASMLIAAAEWWNSETSRSATGICFAGFGAGFHWGAVLATAGSGISR